MFIWWGTHIKHSEVGRVADFCPFCRGFRAFRLTRVGRAGHLYGISFGKGALVGYRRECETCGAVLGAQADGYLSAANEPDLGLDQLIEQTNPRIKEKYAARLDMERRLPQGKLTADERFRLIREPFVLLNPVVEARAAQIHVDLPSGLGMLGAAAAFGAVFAIAGLLGQVGTDAVTYVAVAVGAVGVLFTLYLLFTDTRRFVRRRMHPRLVRALAPLNPTPDELAQVLASLKSLRLAVARKINPSLLLDDLQRARQEPTEEPS